MNIGVVIPTMNLEDKLGRCLESLKQSVLDPNDELHVVVVDNNSRENGFHVRAMMNSVALDNAYYLYCPWNTGFSRGSNCGAGIVGQVDAFLFLNNDCYVDPHCIAEMMNSLKHGKGDVIGANLRYPNGRVQHAGGIISPGYIRFHHANSDEYREEDMPGSRLVPWVTGACMLVYPEVFWRVGGFSEEYFNGCEDVDLCMKSILIKSKVYYNDKATAIHEEAQTPGRKDFEERNHIQLYKKWNKYPVETFTNYMQ